MMAIAPINISTVSLGLIPGGMPTIFQAVGESLLVENALVQQAAGELSTFSLLDGDGEEILRFREPDAIGGQDIQIGKSVEGGPVLITETLLAESLGARLRKKKVGAETVYEFLKLNRGEWVARQLAFGDVVSIGGGFSLRLNAARTVGQVGIHRALLDDLRMLLNQPLTGEVVRRMSRVLAMVPMGNLNPEESAVLERVRGKIAAWEAAQETTKPLPHKPSPALSKVAGLRLGDDTIRLEPGEKLTLGREGWNGAKHLILDRVGVSRRHAVIRRAGDGKFYIKDLDSTNGTRLNGEPLNAGEEYEIGDSDAIVIGSVYLDIQFFEAHEDSIAPTPLRESFQSVIVDPMAFVSEIPKGEARKAPALSGVARLFANIRAFLRRD